MNGYTYMYFGTFHIGKTIKAMEKKPLLNDVITSTIGAV